MTMYKFLCNE